MKLGRALGFQWLSSAYVAGVSILLTFLLGRILGPATFGTYSYLLTLGALFAILQDGGFRTLIFRELTFPTFQKIKDKLVPLAVGHNLLVTGAGILILLVLPLDARFLLMLAIVSFGLGTVTAFFSSQIRGNGRFAREARWRILVRTLTAACMLGFIFLVAPTIEWIFAGGVVGYCLALVFRPRECSLNPKIERLDSQVYKSMIALLIIDIATLIYFKIDIVMLRHLGQELKEVGYYAASSRLMEGLIFIHLPFATVLFRELRLRAKDSAGFIRFIVKLLMLGGLSPLIIVPAGWIFSQEILGLCYGSEYQSSYPILNLLLVSFVFMIPNLVITQGTLAVDREHYYAVGTCLAAVINIVLNLVLIPAFGARGAAIGTIVTEAFLMIFIGAGIYAWYKGKREKS